MQRDSCDANFVQFLCSIVFWVKILLKKQDFFLVKGMAYEEQLHL